MTSPISRTPSIHWTPSPSSANTNAVELQEHRSSSAIPVRASHQTSVGKSLLEKAQGKDAGQLYADVLSWSSSHLQQPDPQRQPPTLIYDFTGEVAQETNDLSSFRFRSTDKLSAVMEGCNLEGMEHLHISGSAQFSEQMFDQLQKEVYPRKVVVVDTRKESHGFIDGNPVSWFAVSNRNWGNLEKSSDAISPKEAKKLDKLQKKKTGESSLAVPFGKDLKKKISRPRTKHVSSNVLLSAVETEEELVRRKGGEYIRLPINDHTRPDNDVIDAFVEAIRKLDMENCHIHFHCRGGMGRTTMLMSMYDMLHNADRLSLDEIVERQERLRNRAATGTNVAGKEYKEKTRSDKDKLLKVFHLYALENPLSAKEYVPWTVWLKNKQKEAEDKKEAGDLNETAQPSPKDELQKQPHEADVESAFPHTGLSIKGKNFSTGENAPSDVKRFENETYQNSDFDSFDQLLSRAENFFANLPAERGINTDARRAMRDPNSQVAKQSAHMVHLIRGLWAKAEIDPERRVQLGQELLARKGDKLASPKLFNWIAEEAKDLHSWMVQAKQGPLTLEESALGVEAAFATKEIAKRVDLNSPLLKDLAGFVKAKRIRSNRGESNHFQSAHGANLSQDPGTAVRDELGLPVMLGTSSGASNVTATIRFAADNLKVKAETESSLKEARPEIRMWAEGMTEEEAKEALIDAVFHFMREQIVPKATRSSYDQLRLRFGAKTKDVDPFLIFTHSYPEVRAGVELTLDEDGESEDGMRRSSEQAKRKLEAIGKTFT